MSKFNLLYVYDLKPQKPSDIGRLKRKFYYHLRKMEPFVRRMTKSVMLTSKEHEKTVDAFFYYFLKDVEVYKCEVSNFTVIKKV